MPQAEGSPVYSAEGSPVYSAEGSPVCSAEGSPVCSVVAGDPSLTVPLEGGPGGVAVTTGF